MRINNLIFCSLIFLSVIVTSCSSIPKLDDHVYKKSIPYEVDKEKQSGYNLVSIGHLSNQQSDSKNNSQTFYKSLIQLMLRYQIWFRENKLESYQKALKLSAIHGLYAVTKTLKERKLKYFFYIGCLNKPIYPEPFYPEKASYEDVELGYKDKIMYSSINLKSFFYKVVGSDSLKELKGYRDQNYSKCKIYNVKKIARRLKPHVKFN